jgi:hypothetical protein
MDILKRRGGWVVSYGQKGTGVLKNCGVLTSYAPFYFELLISF